MSKEEILKSLARVKREVGKLNVDQAADKARIQQLIDDLEQRLESPGALDHKDMADQIDDTLKELEVEHPTITGILNGIATTLSNYGI
jgi:hypothetical protein